MKSGPCASVKALRSILADRLVKLIGDMTQQEWADVHGVTQNEVSRSCCGSATIEKTIGLLALGGDFVTFEEK